MTVSVRLDDETTARLEELAEQSGRSKSDLLRESLVEFLDRHSRRPSAYELGKHLFGSVDSGRSDLGLNHSRILKDKLRARARRG
jgi:Arc/MetJ-type ribon-helix-helix transcriptional regulator